MKKSKPYMQFIVRILAYTLCLIGVFFLFYGDSIVENGNWVAPLVLLCIGYYRAWNWLKQTLKEI